MLVDFSSVAHTYLVCGYTDLRKGIDGLANIVVHEYSLSLNEDSVFLFCGRRPDRFKALYFDGEGFILLYKRYDQGKLKWPRHFDEVQQLSEKQLQWLFDGFSIHQEVKIRPARKGRLV